MGFHSRLDEVSRVSDAHINQGALDFAQARAALSSLNHTIHRLVSLRRRYGFGSDELVILAACGIINMSSARQRLPYMQPANITSIANYIELPRETVRRKLQIIESRGVILRLASGYVIANPKEWMALVDPFISQPKAGEDVNA